MAEAISTDLIVVAELNAEKIFTEPQGVDKIIADLKAKVARESLGVTDLSVKKNREAIISLAYKVTLSKGVLDNLGKGLVSDWKTKSAKVDAARKIARESIDLLAEETRKPVTLWEEAEDERLAAEKLAQEIEAAHSAALAEHDLFLRAKELEAREAELVRVEAERVAREEAELQAQLEREKAALAKAERVANEERIRKEAVAAATLKAEQETAAAIAEANRKAAEAQAAVEKAERDWIIAEAARVEAAAQVERDRLAAIETAKREQAAAVAAAEAHAQRQAALLESDRKAKEAQAAAAAEVVRKDAERKAADVEHRRSVNKEAMVGLLAAGLDAEQAKAVITAIVGGLVAHVTINY